VTADRPQSLRRRWQTRLSRCRDGGHVAAQADLIVLVGDRGATARDHLELVLRVGEAFEAFFSHGIEDCDLGAAEGRTAEVSQHAGMVGAGVLADDEDGVGFFEVLEQDGSLAAADGLFERDAARLVAHVRAIGNVVRAVEADEELVDIGSFV
jgi:hypothetical protein